MRRKTDTTQLESGYLEGHLLIAMPTMGDPRFQRAVIYMCAHSAEGAMGLIINHPSPSISFPDLLEQLDILPENRARSRDIHLDNMKVHIGGPVETGRGFVLHTEDYFSEDSSLAIQDGVCLTATIDILKAIAAGSGPRRALLALGYAGWAPGQLEHEIQSNGWLNCPADADLIFALELEAKYQRAMAKLGIDPSHLVSDAGHA